MFRPVQRVIKYIYHYTLGVMLINLVVDGVRAVSEWEKKEMIKKGISPARIAVIDNGIEDEAYLNVEALASDEIKAKASQFGDYFIQIGRVYPIKNYETVIKAMPKMPEKLSFVIVGPISDVAYHKKLQKLALDLGLDRRVIFAGVIRGVDKYYLIKKAQMMVHMALWESFCNAVHEGMSQGLPCVVANNTALPLLIEDGKNGYCVTTKDSDMVADRVRHIYEHPASDEITEMREVNRVQGLANSWRAVAQRMGQFYLSR